MFLYNTVRITSLLLRSRLQLHPYGHQFYRWALIAIGNDQHCHVTQTMCCDCRFVETDQVVTCFYFITHGYIWFESLLRSCLPYHRCEAVVLLHCPVFHTYCMERSVHNNGDFTVSRAVRTSFSGMIAIPSPMIFAENTIVYFLNRNSFSGRVCFHSFAICSFF